MDSDLEPPYVKEGGIYRIEGTFICGRGTPRKFLALYISNTEEEARRYIDSYVRVESLEVRKIAESDLVAGIIGLSSFD